MLTIRRRRLFGRRMITLAAAIRRSSDLAALKLDEVADAQAGLARQPYRVRVRLGSVLAEEIDLASSQMILPPPRPVHQACCPGKRRRQSAR